jgi:hypothetical protein
MFAQYAQTLRSSWVIVLPLIALVWFVAMFVGVLVRYLRMSKSALDPVASLPLLDDSDAYPSDLATTTEARHGR